MPLTKSDIEARRVGNTPQQTTLENGDVVWTLPVGSRLMRDYRRSLRDVDGKPIKERKEFADELLIARVLVDASGQRMFSDQEVLDGALNDLDPLLWDALMDYAWSFIAPSQDDADRSKKS